MNRPVVFFDANCAMCQFFKRWFHRVKRRHANVEWRHYEEAAACGLHDKACGQSLHIQTATGEIVKGFYAVRYLLGFTRLFWLAPLLYVPGVPMLGEKVYAYVANNRYRFFGKADGPS